MFKEFSFFPLSVWLVCLFLHSRLIGENHSYFMVIKSLSVFCKTSSNFNALDDFQAKQKLWVRDFDKLKKFFWRLKVNYRKCIEWIFQIDREENCVKSSDVFPMNVFAFQFNDNNFQKVKWKCGRNICWKILLQNSGECPRVFILLKFSIDKNCVEKCAFLLLTK